ncbi:Exonuclease [Gammaproteobacteria bacterium]
MEEIYVSTDIEADGPMPGPHSMLSLGSAAFSSEGKMISTFSANLHFLDGAVGHPNTMAWWSHHQDAWGVARSNLQNPAEVMAKYATWLKYLPGRPIFVGYPVVYDFLFVHWYLMKFVGENPFGYSAIDIKTYAMAVLRLPYQDSAKPKMPKRWFSGSPHTHRALDDAIEQGELFCNMLNEHSQSSLSLLKTEM